MSYYHNLDEDTKKKKIKDKTNHDNLSLNNFKQNIQPQDQSLSITSNSSSFQQKNLPERENKQKLSTLKLKTIDEISLSIKENEKHNNDVKDFSDKTFQEEELKDISDDISERNFIEVWQQYLKKLKDEGNHTLYNILKELPQFENNIIKIKVQNKIQEDFVKKYKTRIN